MRIERAGYEEILWRSSQSSSRQFRMMPRSRETQNQRSREITLLDGMHARQKTTQLRDPTALIKLTVALGDESFNFDFSNMNLLDQ